MKEKDFNKVYAEHYKNVFAQAFKHLKGDFEAVEDVVQKVFLIYFTKGHQYKGDSKIGVWLYSVCRNECNMIFRRRGAKALIYTGSMQNDYEYIDIPKCDPIEPFSENIKRAFKSLPELERKVLEMSITGYSSTEIGLILSMTVPAVKSRIHRARLKIKAGLKIKPKNFKIELPPVPVKKKAKIIEMPHRKGRPKPPRFYTPFYKKAANG